jgi:hypothetical protein
MSDTWIVPARHPGALQEAPKLYQLRAVAPERQVLRGHLPVIA